MIGCTESIWALVPIMHPSLKEFQKTIGCLFGCWVYKRSAMINWLCGLEQYKYYNNAEQTWKVYSDFVVQASAWWR